MEEIAAVTLGYLAGSVPFAFLLARRRGIDLRRSGSGNIGAANVFRTGGARLAVAVFCLDVGKGALAVLAAQRIADAPATPVAAGLASVVGHVYPVWLRFHGGKGVATTGGVFLVLAPAAAAVAAGVFAVTVWWTRYVSVGSMSASMALAGTAVVAGAPAAVTVGAMVAAVIVVHSHRSNLGRLAAGTERRIGQRT